MNAQQDQDAAVAAIALLDEPNRRRLYEYVTARREPVGRVEAAAAMGIGRELAAFHLDRLAEAGLLDIEYRRLGPRRGPGGGRPAKLYRRSESEVAVSLPARDYARLAELLATAIERADASTPRHTAERAADGAAHERGVKEGGRARARAGAARSASSTEPKPHEALMAVLRGDGYMPEAGPDGSIRLQNCPYHVLSAGHRELTCGMNLAWAEGVLEGLDATGLDARLAPEPGYCCVVFSDAEVTPGPGESAELP